MVDPHGRGRDTTHRETLSPGQLLLVPYGACGLEGVRTAAGGLCLHTCWNLHMCPLWLTFTVSDWMRRLLLNDLSGSPRSSCPLPWPGLAEQFRRLAGAVVGQQSFLRGKLQSRAPLASNKSLAPGPQPPSPCTPGRFEQIRARSPLQVSFLKSALTCGM